MTVRRDVETQKGGKPGNKNNKISKILAVLFFVVVVIFCLGWAAVTSPNTEQWSVSIAVGVIGSLLASLVYSVMSETVFNDYSSQNTLDLAEDMSRNVGKVQSELSNVQSELSNLNKYKEDMSRKMGKVQSELSNLNKNKKDGLERIELIDATDTENDLWIDLLNKSNKRLDIIAHTLAPWFEDKYEKTFQSQIKRIVENGGNVRIIVLEPNSFEGINTNNDGQYRNKIRRSLGKMINIANSIDQKKQRKLQIKLCGKFDISYAYIRNDENTYVSPYLCSNEGRSSFITVLRNESKLAAGFEKDFEAIFDNNDLKDFNKTTFPIYVDHKESGGKYHSRTWNREDTTRYIYRVGESLVEAGFYKHYMNSSYVESVIELSTSYGCNYKCKYCASSSIEGFTPLEKESLLGMFYDICGRHGITKYSRFILAMTGIGDYSKTYGWTNDFLESICESYPDCQVVLSSCAWTLELIKKATECCPNKLHFQFLQWTYITTKNIQSIIPGFPENIDISKMGDILAEAMEEERLNNKIRINYLMIKDINDNKEAFEEFFKVIEPVKSSIMVRISSLNETNCSQKNNLHTPNKESLKLLREMCKKNQVKAYIYMSEKNDRMNCGQLITESE